MRRRREHEDSDGINPDDGDQIESVASLSLYHPPWRERLGDGKLGPEFGPTRGQYEQEIRDHGQSLEGGGFWDKDQDPLPRRRPPTDSEMVRAYVEHDSANVPDMELEVYFAVFRDGMSTAQAAREIGTSDSVVRSLMSRLRKRAGGTRWL